MFLYRDYIFQKYINKSYFSFNKLLKYVDNSLSHSLLPFDIFTSSLLLDFEKSIELVYGSFCNYKFSTPITLSNSIDSKRIENQSYPVFGRRLYLIAPLGYL